MFKCKLLIGIFSLIFCFCFSGIVLSNGDTDTATADKTVTITSFDLTPISPSGSPKSMKDLAFKVMKFLNLTIAGVSLVGVMSGGVMLIVSAGNESLMQKGKDVLKYSIIGLVVTLSAYLIVTLVQTILYSLGT